MKIINPLYDKAFKYLMQNERLAKKVLSVILDQEVGELYLSQQETVVPDEKRGFTLFRLDFKAVIIDENGEKQKVLIELQKSKFTTDIMRFRTYLGANYLHSETKTNEEGEETTAIYPIITIYILGYKISDIPYMAVSVNRKVINLANKKPIKINSEFINHLTHRSHILQVRRLPEERRTKLEKFMILFNQAWITENKYIIDLQDVPIEFEDIVKYLQGPVMDSDFRRQLEEEEEIDNIFDQQEAKYLKQIKEAKEKEKESRQKLLKSAKEMKNFGMPIESVQKATGLSKEEIEKL